MAFSISLNNEVEPKTYKIASQSNEWTEAMKAELEALNNNKTWSIVSP